MITRFDAQFREAPAQDEAGRRLQDAERTCIELAQAVLPARVRRAFEGLEGRYALALVACGSSLSAYPDLRRHVGSAEWQAVRRLNAHPGFRWLVDRYERAFFDWCELQEAREDVSRPSARLQEELSEQGYWCRCIRRMCGTWLKT
ncbi:hypothetical protein FAZ95_33390 [Trinickia violacea]|uniref:Uncharacterized protein n=1 Tax=Trinickia violacea TaxID=2571746 RepID=A0A4P8IZ75_9BURK|nr:hypothetical protein [Trinickia violacea]QCP53891.1 hypothetical protein FAZ95_33390 [Trinickia violacea]